MSSPAPFAPTPFTPNPRASGPRRYGRGFWAGLAGFVVVVLAGMTNGLPGVLAMAGFYLVLTAIFHCAMGHSWLTPLKALSRKQAMWGIPAGLALMATGGAATPTPVPAPAPAIASPSASTPAASPTATPTRAATPSATARPSATRSPVPLRVASPVAPSSTSTTSAPATRQPFVQPTRRAISPAPQPTHARTTTPTHTTSPARTREPAATSGGDVVHPGAFCSPAGATGVSSKGTPMMCQEAAGGRLRWKRA